MKYDLSPDGPYSHRRVMSVEFGQETLHEKFSFAVFV